ncbi:MAG: NAD+ synthase [Deltaproteobacteria bacterium]|nr:NAD+ synthase [Deltaproteobacteria bacterium]
MKIAICQINTTVGDFKANGDKILQGMRWAREQGASLAVFPELTLFGYPPRDLLDRPYMVEANEVLAEKIASHTDANFGCVFGMVSKNENATGRGLYNTAVFAVGGKIELKQHKTLLPLYDVFDEARHFDSATDYNVIHFNGVTFGLSLCEDIWSAYDFNGRKLYSEDPVSRLKGLGAEMLINISASPFSIGKAKVRRELLDENARRHDLPIVYCNLTGGNDELVFDGRSIVVNRQGLPVAEGKPFAEDFFTIDTNNMQAMDLKILPGESEDIYHALVLGLKDYVAKCGFKKVLLGLSGGIDSALVAAIAAEAVGPENVLGVLMPSPYSSQGSIDDSFDLAKRLGIETRLIPIEKMYHDYLAELSMGETGSLSLTHENIQPRIRGTLLMALSNSSGALLMSTGNKSELSCGYCTLYGDMAGGFSVISDVTKTAVFELCRWINRKEEIIPKAILEKAPSAELKPDQKDQDTLPPYDLLDTILKLYIEEHLSGAKIIARGFDEATVKRIVSMVDTSEYKRRQAAPGIKLTAKAFGMGRRLPIAWRYKPLEVV